MFLGEVLSYDVLQEKQWSVTFVIYYRYIN